MRYAVVLDTTRSFCPDIISVTSDVVIIARCVFECSDSVIRYFYVRSYSECVDWDYL